MIANYITLAIAALWLAVVQCAAARAFAPPQPPHYAGEGEHIVQQLAAEKYALVEAKFDAAMTRDLPPSVLAEQWNAFRHEAGTFLKVKSTAVTREAGGYHVVAMTCAFEHHADDDVLVTLSRDGRIAGLYFGPKPVDVSDSWAAPVYSMPGSFHEVPITVADGAWHLPGTVTLPNGKGPFAAVVLVPGSPPMDQDSTVGPNKIFKDLAWGLASRGIAVMRYTKRTHQFGAGLGGGPISSFTLAEELSDDARAAVALMVSQPGIDHRQLYLLGHSLGGEAVPPIAAADPKIAGIVLMGTPPGDVLTVLLKRAEAGAQRAGEEGEEHSKAIRVLKELRDGHLSAGDVVDLYGQQNPAGYWSWMRSHAAGMITARLTRPVLILTAGHDVEALPDAFESWKSTLGGHANASVRFYPGLFHLFLPSAATGSGDVEEDWSRPGHVDPQVVDDVASWILLHES
jgi:hypothetical protein